MERARKRRTGRIAWSNCRIPQGSPPVTTHCRSSASMGIHLLVSGSAPWALNVSRNVSLLIAAVTIPAIVVSQSPWFPYMPMPHWENIPHGIKYVNDISNLSTACSRRSPAPHWSAEQTRAWSPSVADNSDGAATGRVDFVSHAHIKYAPCLFEPFRATPRHRMSADYVVAKFNGPLHTLIALPQRIRARTMRNAATQMAPWIPKLTLVP